MGWQDAPLLEPQETPKNAWESAPKISEFSQFREENRQWVVENLPAIGSIGGGILGGVAGPAGSVALGGLLGTVLGTSIGTSAKQITKQAQGESPTSKQVLGEQVRNIAEQTAYELAGQAIGGMVWKGITTMLPSPREGAEIAQKSLQKEGGSLSAAQYYDSQAINTAEAYARAGVGGKARFGALDKANADALDAIKNNLISMMSKDPVNDRVAGKLFQDAIDKGDLAHKAAATGLYKAFDQRAGNVLVDLRPVRLLGVEIAEKIEKGLMSKSEAGGRLVDQLNRIGKTVSFSEAHELRSSLLALSRDLRAANADSEALRNVVIATKQVDEAMEQSAKNLSSNLYTEYKNISAFYRKGREAFGNDIIEGLMKQQPERVGESLFAKGNVSEIIQAKQSLRQAAIYDKTVNPEKLYDRLQAGYLNAMLSSKSAVNVEGEVTAKNLLKDLTDAKTVRQLNVMFTPREISQIQDFARTAYLAMNNKPSQFGVLAPILQAAALGDLIFTGDRPGKDVAVISTPYVLSRFLTNPKAVSIVIKAMKMPAAQLTGPVVSKFTADVNEAMKE